MPKFRLLIADDHPIILEGMRRLLEEEYDLVGTAGDGRALIVATERFRPDAVLVDIAMPLLNGIEATRQIRKAVPNTRVVIVTQHTDRLYIEAAFRAGACAYVVKQSAAADLLIALREVLDGRLYVSQSVGKDLPLSLLGSRNGAALMFGAELTPRQREVLQLVAEGKSIKEIAELLKISPKTVEFHKASIMDLLGLRTTAELTRYAVAHGIVQA